MDAKQLEGKAEEVAAAIGESFPDFQGVKVRADAGEEGRIYVALRGAKKEKGLGESFAEALGVMLEEELEGSGLQFGIAMGRGDRDLLLQIELRS